MSRIVLYFSQCTLVHTFYIDAVLILSIKNLTCDEGSSRISEDLIGYTTWSKTGTFRDLFLVSKQNPFFIFILFLFSQSRNVNSPIGSLDQYTGAVKLQFFQS